MSKYLFKILLGTLAFVWSSSFVGCTKDDNKSAAPELTAKTETLTFSDETESVQTFEVKANCEWRVVKTDLDWATVEPMSGKGDATISVSVAEMPEGQSERVGKIAFSLIHPEFGKWGEADSKVTVKQYAGGVTPPPSGEAIYANDFDKELAQKGPSGWDTWLDKFEGWKNQTGTGIANVTYDSNGASARTVGKDSASDMSDYKGSGGNNIFFGSNAYLTIGNLDLGGKRKLKLSFGTERFGQNDPDNTWNPAEFEVQLSKDGAAWSKPLTVTFAKGQAPVGRWDLAVADFTLPEGTETLHIKFAVSKASVYRIDDVTLAEGVGGQEVDFDYVEPSTDAKIGEIKTEGKYKTSGTVVARGKFAYIIADETGAMMVYHKDNERAVGDKIAIEGDVTIYNSTATPQFSDKAVVSLVSKDNKWTYNPTVCDGAAMDRLLTEAPVCKEIQYSGVIEVGDKFVNVTVDGATKAIGSVKYIDNATVAELNGAQVVVKGYFIGTSSDKFVNTLPYEIKATGEIPPSITVNPTSLTFAAAGEAKVVTVTKRNADDCTIEASADNAGQFTVAVNGDKVTVTAKENTAESAVKATLTVKLMKAGQAVATESVSLTQSGVSSGNEQTVTLSFAGGDGKGHDEIPFSEGVISAVFAKGSHSSSPRWDADCVRFYGTSGQKNILTVSGSTITKVVFNLNGSNKMEGMTADSGSFSDNVWTGRSSSIIFTAGDKQTRINGITVIYAE